MCKPDDVIRTGGLGFVDALLHRRIQRLPIAAAAEIIDEFAVFILKIRRCGAGDGSGRANAHKRDLRITEGEHHIGVKDGLPCAQIRKIRGNIRELRFCLCDLQKAVHAVVKLMIAGHRRRIPEAVHQVNHVFALGQRADRVALYRVARVYERNIAAVFEHLLLICRKARKRNTVLVLHGTVHIVGVKNHNVPILRCRYAHKRAKRQTQRQKQGYAFFHVGVPFLSFIYRNIVAWFLQTFKRVPRPAAN